MLSIQQLIDDAKCYETVREIRWPDGVRCSHCDSQKITKRGRHNTDKHRQRYSCGNCACQFDDLSRTIFEGHHQPLKVWILCLYFMGLNLSNRQITAELDLNKDDVQRMTEQLRAGIMSKKKPVNLSGEVEFDEVYVVAGHKGQPNRVAQRGRPGRRRRLKGKRGRGTATTEKPPIFGMVQRGGQVALQMLENVQQVTIRPLIKTIVAVGTQIYTDEYNIYHRLKSWGYKHKTVNHSQGEGSICVSRRS